METKTSGLEEKTKELEVSSLVLFPRITMYVKVAEVQHLQQATKLAEKDREIAQQKSRVQQLQEEVQTATEDLARKKRAIASKIQEITQHKDRVQQLQAEMQVSLPKPINFYFLLPTITRPLLKTWLEKTQKLFQKIRKLQIRETGSSNYRMKCRWNFNFNL